MTMTDSPATSLELLKETSLSKVAVQLVPTPNVEIVVPAVHELPVPVTVTPRISAAVERLHLGVQGTGFLTVEERRRLTEDEIDTLIAERQELDALAKFIEARKAAHRVMVYNHFDVEVEASGTQADLDDKAHYVVAGEARTERSDKRFTREVRGGKPEVKADRLQAVLDNGEVEGLGHKDWLACSTEIRVLDEAKTLVHLRKKPQEMTEALRRAIDHGPSTTAFYLR